jgi:hypothetical protein
MLLCSCPQDSLAPDSGVVDSDANPDHLTLDAGLDAAGDAIDAGEPWDPVWHQTAAKAWQTIGPDGQPDCGPGCRVALNAPISHNLYYGHAYTKESVSDVNGVQLLFAPLSVSNTRILDTDSTPGEGFAEDYLAGEFLTYVRATLPSSGKPTNVEVLNVVTGERKVVYTYTYSGPGDLGVSLTALNSSYAFWKREGTGLMSRNLKTGEVRVVTPADLVCVRICTTETAVICGDQGTGSVVSIDQESGSVTPLDYGNALQIESGCSSDRTQVAWVDYRDPPGPGSDIDFNRSGGEIYMRDLVKNETQRLTFDSPSSPRGKTNASIGDGLVVWREPPTSANPNPLDAQDLYATATTMVVLDLASKKKCRIDQSQTHFMTMNSIHGRHIYGYWGPTPDGPRLVDVDLDNPAIVCAPYQ